MVLPEELEDMDRETDIIITDKGGKGQKKMGNGQGMTRHLSAEEYLSRFRKEDRIYPVITLVFYYDVKKWDGAVELYDMFRLDASMKKEILIKDYLPNYKSICWMRAAWRM